jgi:hypothetical protein
VELKKSLRGKKFQSEEELDLALFSFFDGFNGGQWSAAFKMWKNRMGRSL